MKLKFNKPNVKYIKEGVKKYFDDYKKRPNFFPNPTGSYGTVATSTTFSFCHIRFKYTLDCSYDLSKTQSDLVWTVELVASHGSSGTMRKQIGVLYEFEDAKRFAQKHFDKILKDLSK